MNENVFRSERGHGCEREGEGTMVVKPGMRLKSQVDAAEFMVVRAPKDDLDLACGGSPLVVASEAGDKIGEPVAPFNEGSLLGKRYADEDLGLELLCLCSCNETIQRELEISNHARLNVCEGWMRIARRFRNASSRDAVEVFAVCLGNARQQFGALENRDDVARRSRIRHTRTRSYGRQIIAGDVRDGEAVRRGRQKENESRRKTKRRWNASVHRQFLRVSESHSRTAQWAEPQVEVSEEAYQALVKRRSDC